MSDKDLDEIEFLLTQSMNGVHLLFDNQLIAKVLTKPTEEIDFFKFENMDRIQDLFTQLLEQDSMRKKLDFIGSLDTESYEILLRTYFHIVDNTLLASIPFKH